jgi:superfamily II DNA or RNA helicase
MAEDATEDFENDGALLPFDDADARDDEEDDDEADDEAESDETDARPGPEVDRARRRNPDLGGERVLDPSRVATHLAKFSDRAIQRVVGGNAFLRGRQYARRGDVLDLATDGSSAMAHIHVKQDTYEPRVALNDDLSWASSCTCPGFRGPTAHCKHVAALLVALRDRERPPRPKQGEVPTLEVKSREGGPKSSDGLLPAMAHTVSVGGKRRRSRRRRRGEGVTHLEMFGTPAVTTLRSDVRSDGRGERDLLSLREGRDLGREPVVSLREGGRERDGLGLREGISRSEGPDARSIFEAWLPSPEEERKPLDLEFRMQVRSASIAITPVVAGTRTPVPIADALAAWNGVAASLRPVMRTLARHATRSGAATAEIRGEDAAEVLSMLRDKRVLLEPASMELRFSEEPLRPRIELDQANGKTCRVRVVFETKNGLRRFPLSSGAWFEGTPGWHVDTTEGIARTVEAHVTPAWLTRLYRSPALIAPINELPRLLGELLPKLAALLNAELPDLAQVADIVDAAPRFRLQTDGDILEARVKLQVRYADGPMGAPTTSEHLFPVPPVGLPAPLAVLPPKEGGARPRVVRRDVGLELVALQQLLSLGLVVDESKEGLMAHGDAAIAFWTDGITRLPAEWEKLVPADLRAVKIRDTSVTPQVRVGSGVDWLSLDVAFLSGGIAVDEDELRSALEKGRRLVKLPDGTYAPLKAEEVSEVMERLAELVAQSGPGKIPLNQAGRVQELLALVGNKSVSPTAKTLFTKLEDSADIEQIAKPRTLKVDKFRDYQKRGFSWLVFLHNLATGGILADDMGLGKTLQTIALFCWVKSKHKDSHKPTLVVAPTSVVPNWAREIEKFAPSLSTLVWQGTDRHENRAQIEESDVVITSYALLRRDEEVLQQMDFRYVVLDEAQHIKNPLSATARAAKKMKSDRRLALTGTPIENRLSEIWSILDFVSPGVLGSLKAFEEKYARPVERGDEDTIRKLHAIVKPLVLRRTKSEVAPELPAKIEQEMVVPLAEEQSKLYKQMLARIRASVMSEVDKVGVGKAQIQILAALTRLRQAACDPRLTKLNGEWSDETSGKLGALRELVSEAVQGGHRVLVFSQFVEMLKLIKTAMDEDEITYEYLDGSTKDRQERVDHFNDDEAVNVFLISLKAGGTGLNLTGADTVVHFDPWWNPAVEDQATDRAHRIGQSKVVTVYRLIAKGTVEEKILQLSDKKRSLMENVLSTEGTALKGLTKGDIDELFSD